MTDRPPPRSASLPVTGSSPDGRSALLYVPARDAALVDAFTASAPGTELQAVASTTVAAGFTVGPFVCLGWGAGVQVMAFGDIAVETDQPTLPMLTGAGSRTWVEHSLSLNGDAVIQVGDGDDVDAATDLAGGVVLAGGFRLELVSAPAAPPPASPVPAPEATVAIPRLPGERDCQSRACAATGSSAQPATSSRARRPRCGARRHPGGGRRRRR